MIQWVKMYKETWQKIRAQIASLANIENKEMNTKEANKYLAAAKDILKPADILFEQAPGTQKLTATVINNNKAALVSKHYTITDDNLKPENILVNTSILGVKGTGWPDNAATIDSDGEFLRNLSFRTSSENGEIGEIFTAAVEEAGLPITNGIKSYSFCNMDCLKKVFIPINIKRIGDCAFQGCKNLTEITFDPRSLEAGTVFGNGETHARGDGLGKNAFCNCPALSICILPPAIKEIPDYTFFGDTSLTTIANQSNTVEKTKFERIGIGAFAFTSIQDININEELLSSISQDAFVNNRNFKGFNINNNIDKIILNNLTSIGDQAFLNCSAFSQKIQADNIRQIGKYAFNKTRSGLIFSNNTKAASIEYLGDAAFKDTAYIVYDDSVNNRDIWGKFPDWESSSIGFDCSAIRYLTNPKLTTIPSYCFCNALYDEHTRAGIGNAIVVIPRNIKIIETAAFANNPRLNEVRFQGTPAKIAPDAFAGNDHVIAHPEGLTKVAHLLQTIYVPWKEGEVAGAPWGAINATIKYEYPVL